MAEKIHGFLPADAEMPNDRQRLFVRYVTGALIDLAVLGLFAEYVEAVHVDGFDICLLAAILLQIMLKITIAAEHRVAEYFNAKSGGFMKFMRYFGAWVVLFGSKFAILEALTFVFGERVHFGGPLHGVVVLIGVVVVMLVVEEIFVRVYRRMA
jgi:hypothetical protein